MSPDEGAVELLVLVPAPPLESDPIPELPDDPELPELSDVPELPELPDGAFKPVPDS
jgi:hypothetical protein